MYGKKLNFLPESFDKATTVFRVTSNVITSQVAGGLISGMFGSSAAIPVLQQHESIDSLRPGYGCAYADGVRAAYQGSDPGWTDHLEQSKALFGRLDAVSGISPSDGGWHSWVCSSTGRSFGLCTSGIRLSADIYISVFFFFFSLLEVGGITTSITCLPAYVTKSPSRVRPPIPQPAYPAKTPTPSSVSRSTSTRTSTATRRGLSSTPGLDTACSCTSSPHVSASTCMQRRGRKRKRKRR